MRRAQYDGATHTATSNKTPQPPGAWDLGLPLATFSLKYFALRSTVGGGERRPGARRGSFLRARMPMHVPGEAVPGPEEETAVQGGFEPGGLVAHAPPATCHRSRTSAWPRAAPLASFFRHAASRLTALVAALVLAVADDAGRPCAFFPVGQWRTHSANSRGHQRQSRERQGLRRWACPGRRCCLRRGSWRLPRRAPGSPSRRRSSRGCPCRRSDSQERPSDCLHTPRSRKRAKSEDTWTKPRRSHAQRRFLP